MLAGRTIWNVNSTAAGGGVAEMLQVLVGYVQDFHIPIGWLVITGDAGFFAITKRLHNQIHGSMSGAPLGAAEAGHYAQMLAANAVELAARVRPGDAVLLHDPQTAGLAAPLAQAGARVVWRCHIGVDWENEVTRAGWDFLRPHLAAAEAFVFSRREYVPAWIPAGKAWIIPPSIDPFSPKNQQLAADTVRAILVRLGVLDGAAPTAPATFVRRDGQEDVVTRPAAIIGEGRPGPGDPVLIQVSRWDRLKDMAGVMRGFANHVAPADEGYLMLVGPSVKNVSDDPQGAAVYGECLLQWRDLSPAAQARSLLVTLPLDDIDENAATVNALQRHATVIAQKSLAEGFGLTVAEGMWKGRPVIGSAGSSTRSPRAPASCCPIPPGADGPAHQQRAGDPGVVRAGHMGALRRRPHAARGAAAALRTQEPRRDLRPGRRRGAAGGAHGRGRGSPAGLAGTGHPAPPAALLCQPAVCERDGPGRDPGGPRSFLGRHHHELHPRPSHPCRGRLDLRPAARRREAEGAAAVTAGAPAAGQPAMLAAALRAGAARLYCAEAGAELLITQQSWLSRSDFAPFVIIAPRAAGQAVTAAIDWSAAITALDGGALPCSSGERRILHLAASIAAGIPADLGETLTGLDRASIAAAARAVLHAGGHRGAMVTLPPGIPAHLRRKGER